MRKFVQTAFALLLVSCAGPGGLTADQLASLKEQITAFTENLCSFKPESDALGAIISAFYAPAEPFAVMISSAGEAICKAPVTAAVRRRGVATLTRVVATPKGNVVVRGTAYRR